MGPSCDAKYGRKAKNPLNKNKSIQLHKKKVKKRDDFAIQKELLTKKYDQIDSSSIKTFSHFPLTLQTQKGLKKWKYFAPTDIQRESIGLALQGHDILGAAKTGSGKTLAFVIPILECLFCSGWSRLDGLGSLVITPTRELAYQIFEVFNKIGAFHDFSVALVIGGKDLIKERKILDRCNIVICTPGRLLQHMDENPLFSATNLQILVLDEADRILDLGFQQAMNAIIENLPEQRQTLLFSATQTKSVKDLARLSLKNPMYVSVHEHAKHSTPENLQQNYIICEAQSKMDFLWSFLKSHKKHKILVFMASCKQVKYAYEVFCRMKPGISVMALYGSLHQLKRMERYDSFCKRNCAVMFATDVASRGLDFPNVSWVIQLDCPEDVNTYIHRAGRTARYQDNGESLLVLLSSEKDSMLKQLEKEKIPISEIKVSPRKLFSVQKKMEIFCAQDVNLKESAQRAFKAYLKNVFLMKDKTVFDIQKIDIDAYSKSLGLAFSPRIRFVKKQQTNQIRDDVPEKVSNEPEKKYSLKCGTIENSYESDDDFLVPKKSSPIVDDSEASEEEGPIDEIENSPVRKSTKPLTKAAVAKKIRKKHIKPNTKVTFNEEGQIVEEFPKKQMADLASDLGKDMMTEGYNIVKAKLIMDEEDLVDKQLYREKIKEKHRERKMKLKELEGKKKTKDSEMKLDSDIEYDSDRERMLKELPDPDKYYGIESEEEGEEDVEGDSKNDGSECKESNMDFPDLRCKRGSKQSNSSRKKLKRDYDGDLAFDNEEDLALRLLEDS